VEAIVERNRNKNQTWCKRGFSPKTHPMELKLQEQKRSSIKRALIDTKLQGWVALGGWPLHQKSMLKPVSDMPPHASWRHCLAELHSKRGRALGRIGSSMRLSSLLLCRLIGHDASDRVMGWKGRQKRTSGIES